MNTLKRILVGTDLSRYAGRAEVRAAMLARELGSESLDLLHVIGSSALESLRRLLAPTHQETGQRLVDSAREQLARQADELVEKHGITVTPILKFGHTHIEIACHADAIDAGLVLLGDHGGNFARELFLGSTADKLLRKLSRPVLIVKREPRGPYQRVLVPVDFSEPSRRAAEMALRSPRRRTSHCCTCLRCRSKAECTTPAWTMKRSCPVAPRRTNRQSGQCSNLSPSWKPTTGYLTLWNSAMHPP